VRKVKLGCILARVVDLPSFFWSIEFILLLYKYRAAVIQKSLFIRCWRDRGNIFLEILRSVKRINRISFGTYVIKVLYCLQYVFCFLFEIE
jgi:hypothetical protein